MEASSVFLVCLLMMCSVWTVNGRSSKATMDDYEQVEVESKEKHICTECKEAVNKGTKFAQNYSSKEMVLKKMKSYCDGLHEFNELCNKHLNELIDKVLSNKGQTFCTDIKVC